MLDMNYVELKSYINDKIKDASLTRYATSVAVGVTAGKLLAVSNTPPASASDFYLQNFVHTIDRSLGRFNEQINIDIDLANDVARSIWQMRQLAVSTVGADFITPTGPGSFVDKFFGSKIYLEPSVKEFLDKHNEVMITIINRMSVLVQGLMEQQ